MRRARNFLLRSVNSRVAAAKADLSTMPELRELWLTIMRAYEILAEQEEGGAAKLRGQFEESEREPAYQGFDV